MSDSQNMIDSGSICDEVIKVVKPTVIEEWMLVNQFLISYYFQNIEYSHDYNLNKKAINVLLNMHRELQAFQEPLSQQGIYKKIKECYSLDIDHDDLSSCLLSSMVPTPIPYPDYYQTDVVLAKDVHDYFDACRCSTNLLVPYDSSNNYQLYLCGLIHDSLTMMDVLPVRMLDDKLLKKISDCYMFSEGKLWMLPYLYEYYRSSWSMPFIWEYTSSVLSMVNLCYDVKDIMAPYVHHYDSFFGIQELNQIASFFGLSLAVKHHHEYYSMKCSGVSMKEYLQPPIYDLGDISDLYNKVKEYPTIHGVLTLFQTVCYIRSAYSGKLLSIDCPFEHVNKQEYYYLGMKEYNSEIRSYDNDVFFSEHIIPGFRLDSLMILSICLCPSLLSQNSLSDSVSI